MCYRLFISHVVTILVGSSLGNFLVSFNLGLAKNLLTSYVREFQELYGLRNMSFNIHCLLHLPDVVYLLGPLIVSSSFGYESLNGRLARLVHGTRHAGLQIQSHLSLLRHLSPLVESLPNIIVKEFCQSMICRSQQLNVFERVGKGVAFIGKFIREHMLPLSFSEALCVAIDVGPELFFFFRLKNNRHLYVAEDYGRGCKNSSCVAYSSESGCLLFGCIKVFVKVKCCRVKDKCSHRFLYKALI